MIRFAEPEDVTAIVGLVHELATYERAADKVQLTPERLQAALFGASPAAFCHVAEVDGEVVGMALWFVNFSTWLGVHGVYLEDLYVRPEQRRAGIGRALLETLARVCVDRGYGRLEWAVLDWNEPAIAFYQSIGAVAQDEWTVHRVSGPALRALAGSP
ncbi:MAG: GNAT family N-acetyltransferase [Actinomycetes bacterium]